MSGTSGPLARPLSVTRLVGMVRVLDEVPPASWAIVMAAGIVSVDLYLGHQPVLSAIMVWLAGGVWLVLGVRLAVRHDRLAHEARSPVAFTAVAGTAVLGGRLAMQDYHEAGIVFLALSAVWWAMLIATVLRHWKTPTVGSSFVLSVATEGLAVLAATLAVSYRAGWLVTPALAGLLLGLAFYLFTAVSFDLREVVIAHGDAWVAGGALAISALAASRITAASGALGRFGERHSALTTGTLVLWCLAMAWLPALITAEVVKPRLAYDVRRWTTVFPLGMYSACSFATGQVTGITGVTDFGQIWTWVAFTASLVVLAGLLRQGWLVLRSQHRPGTAR